MKIPGWASMKEVGPRRDLCLGFLLAFTTWDARNQDEVPIPREVQELVNSGQVKHVRWATCCHKCGGGEIDLQSRRAALDWMRVHVRESGDDHLVAIGVEFELAGGQRTGWLIE